MCIIHLTMRLQRGNIGFQTGNIRYVLLLLTITVTYNFTFFYYSWLHLFLFSGIFFFSRFFTSFGNIFTVFFVFFSLSCCSFFLGDVDSFNIMYLMKDSVISIRFLVSVRLFTKITSCSISFINTKMVDICKLSSESNFKNISSNLGKCIYFMNQFVVFFFSVDELGEINSIHFFNTLFVFSQQRLDNNE